ncbi:hypothetical protein DXG01_001234 [Tephrocybe rancida]|nr:hypothetical protein DXG01_001234 [Tephrocybe rancida]
MSTSEPDEMGRSKSTRHSHSLPSFSHLNRVSSDSRRRRTRPRSRSKPYEFFAEAKSSTPVSRRRAHKRSQSNVSQSSSRRASAEFSAEQASSVSHGSEFGNSWEVQVSRQMLRMSFGEKLQEVEQGWADWAENQVVVASESGQARGNRVDAHTQHTSAAKHCSTTSEPPYQVTSGISNRKITSLAMSKDSPRRSSPASKSQSPHRSRTPSPPPKINTIAFSAAGVPSSSFLAPPALSFTAATPDVSPISPILRTTYLSSAEPATSVLRAPATPPAERPTSTHSKGKRKADEAGVEGGATPPKDSKEPRATFAVEPRPHRASANSNSTRTSAPSSYHRKRAKLSTTQESRSGSSHESIDNNNNQNQNAANTGSWSSKTSKNSGFAPSHQSQPPRALPASYQPPQRAPSRRSLSQASIPISALISPHAPSISRSATFHMRDPRKPAPIQRTSWTLSFPTDDVEPGQGWRGWADRGGSPLHAWMFFFGFVLFPLWWVASFMGIRKTRRLDAGTQEKGVVVLDDPQVEHDGKSWRLRCRVMAVVSLLTYIPFIVCVAIFA